LQSAEEILSLAFARYTKNISVITSLRRFREAVMPFAQNALNAINAELLAEMALNPTFQKIFTNLDGDVTPLSEEGIALIRSGLTDTTITSASAAVDAATVIFAHSMVDDCVFSLCEACALAGPEDWDRFVDAKRIAFCEVRQKTSAPFDSR
jgi:hypothetical protein